MLEDESGAVSIRIPAAPGRGVGVENEVMRFNPGLKRPRAYFHSGSGGWQLLGNPIGDADAAKFTQS